VGDRIRYRNDPPGDVQAFDVKTGKRVWHYQLVHHGLWDYDLPAPPVLATITWNGKPRDVVAVPSKTAWIYVFDRETGKPIWPIVERPVPASDVPGERASPTQPMPTNPAPFTRQSVSEKDLIDFTPELNRRAREQFAKYRSGPIFTPPSLAGTIVMPGSIGGAGWGSTSYDPVTHTLYVKETDNPVLYRVQKGVPNDTIGYEYTVDLVRSGLGVTADPDSGKADHTPPEQLPLFKPPYGTMTAIDLDTRTGAVVWQFDLPAGRGYANPVACRGTNGVQYIVVATGGGDNAALVAFSLDGKR